MSRRAKEAAALTATAAQNIVIVASPLLWQPFVRVSADLLGVSVVTDRKIFGTCLRAASRVVCFIHCYYM